MDVALHPLLIVIILASITVVYFRKGQALTLFRRIAASAHGVLALLILPAGILVDKRLVESESAVAGIGIYSCSLLAISSIVYSVIALKEAGFLHLIHLLTFGGIVLVFFVVGLGVFGPG